MLLIVVICLISVLLYLYGTRKFNYWESKGVKCDKPYPFVGNSFKQLMFQVSITDFFTEIYNKYPNERFIGLYAANNPALIITEPRDIQRVLITDFNIFYQRGLKIDKEDTDPFLKHLFMADGDLWKLLRQRMTPAFTTGKLKAMFPLITERAEKLQNIAAERANDNKEVDIKDLMARYTTDFIGACGFGIHTDALDDENSMFRKLGNRIFQISKFDIFKQCVKVLMPSLTRNITSVPPEVTNMTTSLVKSIMEERNYQPSPNHDFIDLLLEVKQKGKMIGESIEKKNPDGTPIVVEQELDDQLIAAQAFIFFAAGFETSSSTSSYTMHQLAFNQEEQKKCQEEIDEVLQKYDNKLCYDAINEMKYLKMCFK
jgi:cytochrome P450 family 6